jgi:hypothetical protein
MGIRFRCPNGHKIHVKMFLAGRRGICPKCGTKVAIPTESAPEFAERNRKLPVRPVAAAAGNRSADVAGEPQTLTEESSRPTVAPPIQWFVRPAAGGQYGPAPDSVLREWLAAGRVTPDAYVWREGWAEWQTAQAAFGDLVSESTEETVSPPELVTWTAPTRPSPVKGRRSTRRKSLQVVGLLGLACLLLLAALVYVVVFRK